MQAVNEIVSEQDRQEFFYQCQVDPCFFVERALHDEYGEPYVLEEYQREFLRCQARNRVLFWARRLSKSLMIKFEVLHKSAFNKAFKSMVVSPSWEQSKEFGEDIQDIVNSTDWLNRMFTTFSKTKFKLKNNSRFSMVSAGNKGVSNLGKGVRLLAFDETQQIPDEVFTFLRPTLLGQKKGLRKWMIYAGTPLGRIGQFYDIYSKGRFFIKMDGMYENEEVPLQKAGDYIVFERPTAILNDEGTEIIGTGTNRVTIDELIQDMNDLPTTGFLREYALKFLDSIGEVFSQALINSILDRNREPEHGYESNKPIIFGLDIGKFRNNSVLTVAEVAGKNKIDIIYVIEYPLERRYDEVCQDVLNLRARYPNAFELRMDETGVGKGVIEIYEKEFEANWRGVDVEGFDFSGQRKKKEFVEAGVAMLEGGDVKMGYNVKMVNEMLEFRREITDNLNIIYRKQQGGSDDYVDSLLLALLGAREYYDYDQQGHNDIVQTSAQLMSFARDKLRKVRI